MNLDVEKTKLPGVILINPKIHEDDRGLFYESFSKKYGIEFCQSNISISKEAVVRGLHAQKNNPQGKLVTVLRGFIYDVAVDVHTGEWQGFNLGEGQQIYIPPGYYHGFFSRYEETIIEYKVTAPYDQKDEIGVIWNDKSLRITWPVPHPQISSKDAKLPNFSHM